MRLSSGPADDWDRRTGFVGLDWAKNHHDVVAVDRDGRIAMELRIDDDAKGWRRLRERLIEWVGADLSVVAATIETCFGPAVERLLEFGCAVYPISPKAAQSYRDRKAPSGVKDDLLDAWSLADGLRTDGHGWRRLVPDDPMTQHLRMLCRDEKGLIEQRTALVNQLQDALHEYYPAALAAFDDWTMPAAWAFIERFPTPQKLAKAGRRRWEKFLHTHRLYRPQTYEKRLGIFAAATSFCGNEPVTAAKSMLAVALARQLRGLEARLTEYRRQIESLYAQHVDSGIFDSLPGMGPKLGPRILSEMGDRRERFPDAESLQCYAGPAPVSFQSGQIKRVVFRRACNKHLRHAVHLWVDESRQRCVWAQTYYQKKREEGKSHACALRCLGQRWLKILWKMWQTRTPYDEAYHTRNQVRHGSWVVQLSA